MHFDSSCSHVSTAAVIKAKERDLNTNGRATGYQRQAELEKMRLWTLIVFCKVRVGPSLPTNKFF